MVDHEAVAQTLGVLVRLPELEAEDLADVLISAFFMICACFASRTFSGLPFSGKTP